MTAADLLAALRAVGCELTAGPDRLTVAGPLPPPLVGPARVLKTGLRAALLGRPWYGIDARTGRGGPLSPAVRLPAAVSLLTAAGDARWDRVPPTARLELPHLFAG